MKKIFSIYRFIIPLLYIGAGIYFLTVAMPNYSELYKIIAAVISLHGVYRLVTRFDFFRKVSYLAEK
jgi:hypothetical protein